MKTAIYIEDAIVQLVITPENEFEKNALRSFEQHRLECKIFAGTFYDCRGGWTRQQRHRPAGDYIHPSLDQEDRSLILRIEQLKADPEQQRQDAIAAGYQPD